MPSSADVERALASAADAVVLAASEHDRPVVLIDGRSGAGKTTLARVVAERLDATLLALDSVYPGWDGLATGAQQVIEGVLRPRLQGLPGVWRRWDWERGAAAESHEIPAGRALVIEGAGILTPASRGLSGVQVWLESPEQSRRVRALERDGDAYRPHWTRWARQEDTHLRDHDPASLASLVVVVP